MSDTILRFTFSTLRSSHGAALSVANTNLGKLSHISGPGLPLAPVAVPANTSVSYAIVYEGNAASDAADDIGPMTVSFRGIMIAEMPCYETNAPSGYFATTNFAGFMTHSADAGAGIARRVQGRNRWTVDEAGGVLYQNWSSGQLKWNVPIGWIRLNSDYEQTRLFTSLEYETWANGNSRPLLIGGRSDLYTQTFRIGEDGTARIDKFGHWLSRSRHCRIILDGETRQLTHPLW